ncbi:MAG: nucleotidyltransferase family protein [Thermoplasmata archaeon]|nr:nucleotidyltransferase family protein [Thermoplasmata archaeon]MCI4354089.1 nucleotidyltransferase family protein [Thermoplasmata archaeon]
MPELTPPILKDLVEAFRRNQIEYIVVGGQAVAEEVPVMTQDLDVMVALRDFDTAIARLRKEPMFGREERKEWIARWEAHSRVRPGEVADVDLLNGRPYCGDLTPDEFFDYLRDRWTTDGVLGRTVRPPVVWYTRLLAVGFWGGYALKVIRDLRAGAPVAWLGDVREIARRTGTLKTINERIAYVEDAVRPEPDS